MRGHALLLQKSILFKVSVFPITGKSFSTWVTSLDYSPAPNSLLSQYTKHLSENLTHYSTIGLLSYRLDNPLVGHENRGHGFIIFLSQAPPLANIHRVSHLLKYKIIHRSTPLLLLGLHGWPIPERIISNLFVQYFCWTIHPQTN